MPMYSYRCGSCGHEFSIRSKIDDRKVPTENPCEECGESEVSQMIGTPLVSYSTNPGMTVSDNFTDRLKQIRKAKGPSSTIHTKN